MRNRELLSYFNLSADPFTREIPVEKLLLLPSVERSLAAAELLVETRGIGVMTGKSGTGKSCLLRLLIDRLQPGLYKSYYVCHTSVAIVEFYPKISDKRAHAERPEVLLQYQRISTGVCRRGEIKRRFSDINSISIARCGRTSSISGRNPFFGRTYPIFTLWCLIRGRLWLRLPWNTSSSIRPDPC